MLFVAVKAEDQNAITQNILRDLSALTCDFSHSNDGHEVVQWCRLCWKITDGDWWAANIDPEASAVAAIKVISQTMHRSGDTAVSQSVRKLRLEGLIVRKYISTDIYMVYILIYNDMETLRGKGNAFF